MEAKKCDRCGKYYDSEIACGLDAIQEAVNKLSFALKNITKTKEWKDEEEIINHAKNHFDFCPKCIQSFETWLRVGKR